MLSKEQRSLIARARALNTWAHIADPSAHTLPGRTAFLARFERDVDPDGRLDPVDRARRAEQARRAYFLNLAAKSAASRAARTRATRHRATGRPTQGGEHA